MVLIAGINGRLRALQGPGWGGELMAEAKGGAFWGRFSPLPRFRLSAAPKKRCFWRHAPHKVRRTGLKVIVRLAGLRSVIYLFFFSPPTELLMLSWARLVCFAFVDFAGKGLPCSLGEKKQNTSLTHCARLPLMAAIFWDSCWKGNRLCQITTELQWNLCVLLAGDAVTFIGRLFTFREEERMTPNDPGLVHLRICHISILISSDFLCGGRRQRDGKL